MERRNLIDVRDQALADAEREYNDRLRDLSDQMREAGREYDRMLAAAHEAFKRGRRERFDEVVSETLAAIRNPAPHGD